MKVFYQCSVCEAMYSSSQEALNCESQLKEEPLKLRQKVVYQGRIFRILKVAIKKETHRYMYRIYMYAADNPPGTERYKVACHLRRDELEPLPSDGTPLPQVA